MEHKILAMATPALAVGAAMLNGQPQPRTFFKDHLHLQDADIEKIEEGQVITKILESGDKKYGRLELDGPGRGTRATGELGRRGRYRPVRDLNNTMEQDHRAIESRVRASRGSEILSRVRTIQGVETMNMNQQRGDVAFKGRHSRSGGVRRTPHWAHDGVIAGSAVASLRCRVSSVTLPPEMHYGQRPIDGRRHQGKSEGRSPIGEYS